DATSQRVRRCRSRARRGSLRGAFQGRRIVPILIAGEPIEPALIGDRDYPFAGARVEDERFVAHRHAHAADALLPRKVFCRNLLRRLAVSSTVHLLPRWNNTHSFLLLVCSEEFHPESC